MEQILAWADAHHAAHGQWPAVGPGTAAGEVAGAPGESWKAINYALAIGLRGLARRLVAGGTSRRASRHAPARHEPPAHWPTRSGHWEQEQFPVKKPKKARTRTSRLPALTKEEILAWADAHHAATGKWPSADSGRVDAAPFELTWSVVNKALYYGRRGFPGGSSLHLLLAEHRVLREPLSVEQILAWADAYLAGAWPLAPRQRAAPGGGARCELAHDRRGTPEGAARLSGRFQPS